MNSRCQTRPTGIRNLARQQGRNPGPLRLVQLVTLHNHCRPPPTPSEPPECRLDLEGAKKLGAR